MTQKIEGYWYSEYSPQYPMPVANVLTKEEARRVFNLIRAKEKTAHIVSYRGFSVSRLEKNRMLGSREYQTEEWVWPEDFAQHYVLETTHDGRQSRTVDGIAGN